MRRTVRTARGRWLLCLLLGYLVGGCGASSHILVGTARSPIDPTLVKIYLSPPAEYEPIALLDASSKHALALGDQAKTDKMVERLKVEAAAVGANGLLLQGVGDQAAGAIGLGAKHGLGISRETFRKSGQALAIFVTQE